MISIIVPVYNVEKYISYCIESILCQTYHDWELLLIDDGSLDRSGAICDTYAAKDARIRVLHIENAGVSNARNLALENITGEWVCFVDADDAIAPDTLKKCIAKCIANELDIIQFSYSRTENLGDNDGKYTEPLSLCDYLSECNYLVTVWGSLIRTSIISKNNLRFNTKLKLAEDQVFMFECFLFSQKIQKIDDILYFYRDNENGAVRNPKKQDCINSMLVLSEFGKRNPTIRHYIEGTIMYITNDLIRFRLLTPYKIAKELARCDVQNPSTSRGLSLIAKTSRLSSVVCSFVIKYYMYKNRL